MAIRISLQSCPTFAPNCSDSDMITLTYTFTDANANSGSATLTGTKGAINAISNTTFLLVEGVDGASSLNTSLGVVNVVETYDQGYNVDENIQVLANVVDCEGWRNIDAIIGFTNAVMTDQNEYLSTGEDQYLAFIT